MHFRDWTGLEQQSIKLESNKEKSAKLHIVLFSNKNLTWTYYPDTIIFFPCVLYLSLRYEHLKFHTVFDKAIKILYGFFTFFCSYL